MSNWSVVKSAFKNLSVARSLTLKKKVKIPKKYKEDGDEEKDSMEHSEHQRLGENEDNSDDDKGDDDEGIMDHVEKRGSNSTSTNNVFGDGFDITKIGENKIERGIGDDHDDGDWNSHHRRSPKRERKQKKSKEKKHGKGIKGSSSHSKTKKSKKKTHKTQREQQVVDEDTTYICHALGMDADNAFCLRHPNQNITTLRHQYEPVHTCRICASETKAGPRAASRQRKSMAAVISQVQKLQADKRSWRQKTKILDWGGDGNKSSDDNDDLEAIDDREELITEADWMEQVGQRVLQVQAWNSGGSAALRYHPDYQRYFKLLDVGVPLESIKNTAEQDGKDPTVLDLDPDKSLESQRRSDVRHPQRDDAVEEGNEDDDDDDDEYLEVPAIVEKVHIAFNKRRSSQMLSVASTLMREQKKLHPHDDDVDEDEEQKPNSKRSHKKSKKQSRRNDDGVVESSHARSSDGYGGQEDGTKRKKSGKGDRISGIDKHGGRGESKSPKSIKKKKGVSAGVVYDLDTEPLAEDNEHAGGIKLSKKEKGGKTKDMDRSKSRERGGSKSPKKKKTDDAERLIQNLKEELQTKNALIDKLQEKVKELERSLHESTSSNFGAPDSNRSLATHDSIVATGTQKPSRVSEMADRQNSPRNLGKHSSHESSVNNISDILRNAHQPLRAASFDDKSIDQDDLFDFPMETSPPKKPLLAAALKAKAALKERLVKSFSHIEISAFPSGDDDDNEGVEKQLSKSVPHDLLSLHQPSRTKSFDNISVNDDVSIDSLPDGPTSESISTAEMKTMVEVEGPRHLAGVHQPSRTRSFDNVSLDDDELFDPVSDHPVPAKPLLMAALKAKGEIDAKKHLVDVDKSITLDSPSIDGDEVFKPLSLNAVNEEDIPKHLVGVNQPSKTRSFDNHSLDDEDLFDLSPREPRPDRPLLAAALKAKAQNDTVQHRSNVNQSSTVESFDIKFLDGDDQFIPPADEQLPVKPLLATDEKRADHDENSSASSSSGSELMEIQGSELPGDGSTCVPEHLLSLNQPAMVLPGDTTSLDNDDLFDTPSDDQPADRPLLRAALRAREQQENGLIPSGNEHNALNGTNGHHYETVPEHLVTANQPATVSSHDEYSIDEDELFDGPPDEPPTRKPLLNAAMKARAKQEENMVKSYSHLESTSNVLTMSNEGGSLSQSVPVLLTTVSNPSTAALHATESRHSLGSDLIGKMENLEHHQMDSVHDENSNDGQEGGKQLENDSDESDVYLDDDDDDDKDSDDLLDDIARLAPAPAADDDDEDDDDSDYEEDSHGAAPFATAALVAEMDSSRLATNKDESDNEGDEDSDEYDDASDDDTEDGRIPRTSKEASKVQSLTSVNDDGNQEALANNSIADDHTDDDGSEEYESDSEDDDNDNDDDDELDSDDDEYESDDD